MKDGFEVMMEEVGVAVRRYVDGRDLEQRARVHALECQLVWQDRVMTDAIATRIASILTHYDAHAVGEITEGELKQAVDKTVKRWNGKTKMKANGKANGATNGVHPAS